MSDQLEAVRNGPTFSQEIDRHEWSQIGCERYVRDYINPLKPVIITGALDQWPARDKWTFEFFKEQYGDLDLEIDGRKLSMARLIDEVVASTPESPAPYLRNHLVTKLPAALQADIAPMASCTRPNWLEHPLMSARAPMTYTELYIGGKGAKFPVLHYDGLHTHAFLMQIQGVKEYIGFAPDQTPYLYVRGNAEQENDAQAREQPNISEIVDIENWDTNRFSLFGKAKGIRFTLHPGETLFMPSGWWHTARILTPSITVSINGVNAANWYDFSKDFSRYYMAGRKLPIWAVNAYLLFVGKWLDLVAAV
ncbi:cupin-like domain-containing protein [Bradyrhizobium sp.]|uniref:cupin-like domain-containing protein n=1 Tax=Bradyrhizobium sp. TaxID=376 RepID=UPI0039E4D4F3